MRRIIALSICLALAGCAADGPNGLALLPAQQHAATVARDGPEALRDQPRSLAAKVLAAMALERVTGRKPDPARFRDP